MNIKDTKRQWLDRLAEARTEEVINDIVKFLQERESRIDARVFSDVYGRIVLIAGRWRALEQDAQSGVIDARDQHTRQNQLTRSLVEYLEDLPDDLSRPPAIPAAPPAVPPPPATTTARPFPLALVGGGLVVAAVAAFLLWSRADAEPPVVDPAGPGTVEARLPPAEEGEQTDPTVAPPPAPPARYPEPREVLFNLRLDREMCPGTYGCLIEEFMPVGWSEDYRYFAYVVQPDNEAIGGYDVVLRIADLKTDRLFLEWSFLEWREERQESKFKADLPSVWRDLYDVISTNLRRAEIVPTGEVFTLQPFPLTVDGRTYTVDEQQTYKKFYGIYRGISRQVVTVHAAGLGSKDVTTRTFEKSAPIRTQIIGAIVAPDRSRMAIVQAREYRGWEGPPNRLTPEVIGCALRGGFR